MNEEEKLGTARKIFAPFFGFILALSFLTRFPVKPKYLEDDFVWKWSVAFYPVCGYLLGFCAVAPIFLSVYFFRSLFNLPLMIFSSFYYVAVLEWLTRMLHFDGFCDCCDAFSAIADKEKRLTIMKDPHVGSSAVCGGGLLIMGKLFALCWLVNFNFDKTSLPGMMQIVVYALAVPVFGRFAMLCLAAMGKYPRETGTGAKIVGKVPLFALLFALITLIPLLVYLPAYSFALCFFFVAFTIFYWKIKAASKIGGVTGDVLGACCETAELAAVFAFLISR
jgi:adenosylcobinamide-GDP ribazoletransferase